ncbi:MAG: S9 family peptidase [Myxococcales bacterium]|nr:S9 family peptidase [Myxococcales bacterium]
MNPLAHASNRSLVALFLLCGLALPAVAADTPHPLGIPDLAALQKVSDGQLSPTGQALYFAVGRARIDLNRWQSAIYVQTFSGPDGAMQPTGPAQRLTFPERGAKQEGQDFSPRLSPDGRWLAFLSTRDGEQAQVYVMAAGGGEAQRISSFPAGAGSLSWMPDGRALIVQSRVYASCPPYPAAKADECNKKQAERADDNHMRVRVMDRLFYRHWDSWWDGKRSHLFRLSLPVGDEPAPVPTDLTPADFDAPAIARSGAQPYTVSPDGRELAYVQNRDATLALSTNNDLFLQALDDAGKPVGTARNITAANQATDVAPRYSPDGRYIAYLAQRRPTFEGDRFEIVLYDRKSGQQRALTAGFDSSVGELAWTLDSQHLIFTAPVSGRGALFACDLSGQTAPWQLDLGDIHDVQIVRSGRGMDVVFLRSTLSAPAEVFALAIDGAARRAGAPRPLSQVNAAVLKNLKFGKASEIFAQSQDGLRLQAHVVLPPDAAPGRRYPTAVLIHGGPQGAWEDFWQWRWNAQVFAGAGYVVMMPNPRGSEGFGQRFVDQVSADWGGKAYDDIMRLVDQLVAQPYVDSKRVAALGASYGGYMVNWIGTQTDRFAALVSHAGVYDLRSMYGETEEMWFPRWEFQGDPWTTDQYDRFSPSRRAEHYKTPMLVISNERDFRVPVSQGMQLFTALQVRKVPSRLVIFPDENHWVLRPTNSRFWYGVVLDWLHRYIGGAAVDPKILDLAATHAK